MSEPEIERTRESLRFVRFGVGENVILTARVSDAEFADIARDNGFVKLDDIKSLAWELAVRLELVDSVQGMSRYIDRSPDPRISLWIDEDALTPEEDWCLNAKT